MILILSFIFFTFLCFFVLFILSKQDFVLLRQNISLSEVFDAAIIVLLIALFVGRIFYILDTFNFGLLHALRFFYITRFHGMSMLGFIIGGAFAIKLLFRNKKGLRRIYDIFAISFYPLFILFIILQLHKNILYLIPAIILSIVSFVFFVKSHQKYILKDGSNALVIVALILFDIIASQFFLSKHALFFGLSSTQIISILTLPFIGISIYITQKSGKN